MAALLGSALLGASQNFLPMSPGVITPAFVSGLLERYAAADYAAVDAGLRAITDIKTFKAPWSKAIEPLRGVTNLGETERNRRRLIAATLALEVANRLGIRQPYEAAELVEAGCKFLQITAPPPPAERAWQWAAIALLESIADGESLEIHSGHARSRFPDEPRFVLARAVAAELRTFPAARDESPVDTDSTLARLMVARLQEAKKDASTRDEAKVRLGYFYLRLGRDAPAVDELHDVSQTVNDRYLRYLANLIEGRALTRLNRLPEAIAAYRSATLAVPGAQTAEMMLAAALAMHGDRAEAAAIAQRSVTTQYPPADPWTLYGQSDVRFWPQIIASLRAGLK